MSEIDETDDQLRILKSSSRMWQEHMGARLAAQLRPALVPSSSNRRILDFAQNWAWSFSILGIAAILLLSVLIWRNVHPTEAKLIAEAYDERRLVELRLPGGRPVPMASGTRGGIGDSAEPVPLLELRLRAQKHLEHEPQSAYWHQIMGEVNLIENDGISARRNLEIARNTDASLPHIAADLAGALFEIAQQSGKSEYYAQAAELYSQELRNPRADKGILLYNRAICWQRLGAIQNALSDLRTALSFETSREWRQAIESKLASLNSSSNQRPPDSVEVSAKPYEDALQVATEDMLPRWKASPAARMAIAIIARNGSIHGDHWLSDWVRAPHSLASERGDRQLAAAVRFGRQGDAQQSLRASLESVELYGAAKNRPGQARALLAEVYALQRLDRAEECLRLARMLRSRYGLGQYSWIQNQLSLEIASCQLLRGDYSRALQFFGRTIASSSDSRLTWLELRALGAKAQTLASMGNASEAIQLDSAGLDLCHRSSCPAIREFLFLYTMVNASKSIDLDNVALELMKTAASLAEESGDLTTRGYAIENLALLEARMREFTNSERDLQRAFDSTASNSPLRTVELYRAELDSDKAEVFTLRGEPKKALETLHKSSTSILESDYQPGRLGYFLQKCSALQAMGGLDGALSSCLSAVTEAEKPLSSMHSVEEKEAWQRENLRPYAQLISIYLRRGENAAAFHAWERYRSLPYRNTNLDTSAKHPDRSELRTGSLVLVIGRANDGYVEWLVSPSPLRVIQTKLLPDQTRVRQLATNLYHLCSDPDSAFQDVVVVGKTAYSVFLSPFNELQESSTLSIDVDRSLIHIPFAALVDSKGEWFGSGHELTLLPPWWSLASTNRNRMDSVRTTTAALVINGFTPGELSYSEAKAIAANFSDHVLVDGFKAVHGRLVEDLRRAGIIHFSGHATSAFGPAELLVSRNATATSLLTAQLIRKLDLRHSLLAVLAACNTASDTPTGREGDPDIRDALLLSGVHSVIATQWDVDDRCTAELMHDFYKELLKGNSPSESLRVAGASVRSHHSWLHPYFWASFETFTN